MKVKTELPESEKPERAWLEGSVLHVDYHKFQETGFVYTDRHAEFLIEDLVEYVMYFGKRRGFKKMEIWYRHPMNRALTKLALSNNHKALVVSIYNLLKSLNIKPRREVI